MCCTVQQPSLVLWFSATVKMELFLLPAVTSHKQKKNPAGSLCCKDLELRWKKDSKQI